MSKIDDAQAIIVALGFPVAQHNERSALCLLALVQLRKRGSWQKLHSPMLGVRAILDFCRSDYKKPYAENSRESFRKETLHQFVSSGLVLQNPDDLSRAPNSPKWCYQIAPDALDLLLSFGTQTWNTQLKRYLAKSGTLSSNYKAHRESVMVSCSLPQGQTLNLSPGAHSELIARIIEEFAPRFAPGAQVLYVGDTGNKGVIQDLEKLAELGVVLHERGKMPDVVLYRQDKNWLYVIESVTSVGAVDGKRHRELSDLLSNSKAGTVFVTAFPHRKLMARFLTVLAWETEVWCAEDPSHLIHFNGDRFMGPHG